MDISEAIDKRRTIRKYKSPDTEEQVLQIITEGVKAPSAGNRQTWEFVLVDDPDLIEKFVREAVQEVGATTPKDMGKVMKVLMPRLQGQADGKLVNTIVKEVLS